MAPRRNIKEMLEKRWIGLKTLLDAWSMRVTGKPFLQLVGENPRLAITIAYQVLGERVGGVIANIILESYGLDRLEFRDEA